MLNEKKKSRFEIKPPLANVINYSFQIFLVIYLALLLLEQLELSWIKISPNLNYLLIIVMIMGILDVFSEHEKEKEKKPGIRDYVFISALAILGFIIIKFKTGDLGWLSWLVSIIAGILIFLLSLLILNEEDDESKENDKNRAGEGIKFLKELKRELGTLGVTAFVLTATFVFLAIIILLVSFTSLTLAESIRVVSGSLYALFLPGFVLSFLFFKYSEIDWIERIALSFALSIAIVPLAVFYLNLIGIKINLLNSSLIILGIIIISLIILYFRSRKHN